MMIRFIILLQLFASNCIAGDKIVGVVDILPMLGEVDSLTGNCCVKPKRTKTIVAGTFETGRRTEAFSISFNDLPEMIGFAYDRKFALAYRHEGVGGSIQIKKNGKLGSIGTHQYRQYFSYPELLQYGLIRNNHVRDIYSFTGTAFKKISTVKKGYHFEYHGNITVNGKKWVFVKVYSQNKCEEKLPTKPLYTGWVEAYKGNKPTLWIYPKGC